MFIVSVFDLPESTIVSDLSVAIGVTDDLHVATFAVINFCGVTVVVDLVAANFYC